MSGQGRRWPAGSPAGEHGPGLDIRHARPARVYNYWLGGKHNFAADRWTRMGCWPRGEG